MNDPPDDYAGFVTRAIAFAIDIALVDLGAAIVAIVVGLGISAFNLPDTVVTIAVVGAATRPHNASKSAPSCAATMLWMI